jgi:hypothetical protein
LIHDCSSSTQNYWNSSNYTGKNKKRNTITLLKGPKTRVERAVRKMSRNPKFVRVPTDLESAVLFRHGKKYVGFFHQQRREEIEERHEAGHLLIDAIRNRWRIAPTNSESHDRHFEEKLLREMKFGDFSQAMLTHTPLPYPPALNHSVHYFMVSFPGLLVRRLRSPRKIMAAIRQLVRAPQMQGDIQTLLNVRKQNTAAASAAAKSVMDYLLNYSAKRSKYTKGATP